MAMNPMLNLLSKSSATANNPAMSGNPMQMIKAFGEFKQLMRGRNPQAMVEKLLSTNQMTAQQFEALKAQANELKNILR